MYNPLTVIRKTHSILALNNTDFKSNGGFKGGVQGAWPPFFGNTAWFFPTHFNKLTLQPCTGFIIAQFRQTFYFQ